LVFINCVCGFFFVYYLAEYAIGHEFFIPFSGVKVGYCFNIISRQ
jgi:hypothetical protein